MTRPYTPRTNGKAERFIQTSLREWAYARPYRSSAQRANAIAPWIDAYNATRVHSALGHPPLVRPEQPSWKRHLGHLSEVMASEYTRTAEKRRLGNAVTSLDRKFKKKAPRKRARDNDNRQSTT